VRKIVWVDAETTTLDVADPRSLLLEVALVVTELDLTEIAAESLVIRHDPATIEAALWDPIARAMHEENGLLRAAASSDAVPLGEVERRLLDLLVRYAGVSVEAPPDGPGFGATGKDAPLWGGCSPWLDRTVIRRVIPRLYERIHYRTLDATTIRLALDYWTGEKVPSREKKPHRALEDARDAVKLAAAGRNALLGQMAITT
jgi:oligoribonuclease